MRLTSQQIQSIRDIAYQIAGKRGRVHVFGSRLDDNAWGGDLDLLIELPEAVIKPALMAVQISARVSRLMYGRKVDVIISAPNLKQLPIHEVALKEGQAL
jgi:predicted nucleotidyltransferase